MDILQKCAAPWYKCMVDFTMRVAPCCYYAGKPAPWSNDDPQDVDFYWNSKEMQAVRSIIKSKTLRDDHGCHNCFTFRIADPKQESSYPTDFAKVTDDFGPVVRANWEKAVEEFSTHTVRVESKPLRYFFLFGYNCDIRCRMCVQERQRVLKEFSEGIKCDSILRFAEHFPKAMMITVMGGEPLCEKEAVKFINSFIENEAIYSNQRLQLVSNGLTLHRFMDTFQKKRKLWISVSLDGVGKQYEYVRAGSNWDQVEKNILHFRDVGKKLGLEWSIFTSNNFSKQTLMNLPAIVDWHIKNDIQTCFYDFIYNVTNYEFFNANNIFNNKELLNDIDGWEDIILDSIAKLQKHGNPAATSLELIYNQLRDGCELCIDQSYFQIRDTYGEFLATLYDKITAYLRASGNNGEKKRLAVFGSAPLGLVLADYISRTGHRFVGFLDNTARPECANVFPASALERLHPDAVVVSSCGNGPVIYEQIKERCAAMGTRVLASFLPANAETGR